MPIIRRSLVTAGSTYFSPMLGPTDHTAQIAVNVAALTTAEVDADGYIKPGVPLDSGGALVASTKVVYGVVPEAVRVAASNASADLTAAGTVQVAVATIGQVQRHIAEANLGRAYNANELAGFNLAGSKLVLVQ